MNRAPEKPGEKRARNEYVFGERNLTIKPGKGIIWKRMKTKRPAEKLKQSGRSKGKEPMSISSVQMRQNSVKRKR